MQKSTLSINNVLTTLCKRLYPYACCQYVDDLVYMIHRIFGSEYMRWLHENPNQFFNLIENISTKYVGRDMISAVQLAYLDDSNHPLFS